LRSISNFSINLVGFGIFNYFSRNADYLLIGRYLGAQALGYYTLAYRILLFPVQNISGIIRRVVFPLYSGLQDENERIAGVYLRVASAIALISFPAMMGILVLAKPFVYVFFGEIWKPAVPVLMILAPVGLTQSIGTMVGTIYQAKGRTDWMFRWGLFSGSYLMLAFVIGLNWGIVGVAIAYALATFSLTYLNHSIPFRLIGLSFTQLIRAVEKPFFNSLVMLACLFLFNLFIPPETADFLVLVVSIGVGVLVYGFLAFFNDRDQLKELWMLSWGRTSMQ
jgi:PST family polysaccharide transporter